MLTRIDDFPTGIRPVEPDLMPFMRILQAFEQRQLPYVLGMVPMFMPTMDPAIIKTLRELKYMTPAVHGYTHCYPKYSPLVASGMLHTAPEALNGSFDEFAGKPKKQITYELSTGKGLVEAALGCPVTAYIPPCNRCNPLCGTVLAEVGFKTLYSNEPARCALPRIAPDFYGRLKQLTLGKCSMVSIHITWEWIEIQTAGWEAFEGWMDMLKRCSLL